MRMQLPSWLAVHVGPGVGGPLSVCAGFTRLATRAPPAPELQKAWSQLAKIKVGKGFGAGVE